MRLSRCEVSAAVSSVQKRVFFFLPSHERRGSMWSPTKGVNSRSVSLTHWPIFPTSSELRRPRLVSRLARSACSRIVMP